MNVVLVESPAKAKTIEKYLGSDFTVLATYGHVRDLPSKDGSVRPDEDFAMTYEVEDRATKHLREIATAVKKADNLYLATDPDREGEAISWHVLDALKERNAIKGIDVKRVVFHEITRDAVREAMAHPRDIDMALVDAQQARRALDYLVGFTLSPVLWRKLPGSRSAGRVQSVALRLICDREREIESFVPQEYWTVEADFKTPRNEMLTARLTHLDGKKLDKFGLPDKEHADRAVAAAESRQFAVADVERKQVKRHPAPPFITSTLQQEASRKLGLGARRTMQIAQRLYEGIDIGGETVGLITYMRTDSVQLSREAIDGARKVIGRLYGDAYLPDQPRQYKTRARNAQEAHEAIRPTDLSRLPKELSRHLEREELALYDLVWKRTMACQMESARLDQVAVDIASADGNVRFRATGSVVAFDGFLKIYSEGRDEPGEAESDEDRRLPQVEAKEPMDREAVRSDQHFTEPPPRFTEATLVRRLEELGIGRPSTYANIISVLQDRNYVRLDKKRFIPEDRGRLVTAFLESFFERYVRYDFTAELEDQLDQISNGTVAWKEVLRAFWAAFSMAVDDIKDLRVKEVLDALDELLGPHIFPNAEARTCPSCKEGRLSLKLGKFGAFVGCSNYPECKYTRPLTGDEGAGDPAADGPVKLGIDSEGNEITLRKGPYGHYVQRGEAAEGEKPKRASLPRNLPPEDVTLDNAVGLLALPREVGTHPETGKTIQAGLGRFGPYLKHDGAFKSLPAGDDVLTVGLNRAVSLLAEPSKRRSAEPIRVLGPHPDDNEPVAVYNGRYGPYLQHNGTRAKLPGDATPESVTLEEAVPLIAAQAAKGGKSGAKGKKSAAAGRAAKTKSGSTKATKSDAKGAKAKAAKSAAKPASKRSGSSGGAAKTRSSGTNASSEPR